MIIVNRKVSCSICGTEFISHHSQGKYCSPACARIGERASWNKYGAKNRTKRRRYSKSHYRHNRKAIIARINDYRKTDTGRFVVRKSTANQKIKHPEKVKARQMVGDALKSGKLVKGPCSKCGSLFVQAHHTDYSKPLEVMWLCHTCHLSEHGRIPMSGEGKDISVVIEDGSVREA